MDDAAHTIPGPPPHIPPPAPDPLDLRGKADRFSDLLAKSMDLAEIGMNLGLSILSTVGAAAQQRIAQSLTDTASAVAARPAPPAASAPPEQPDYGITNRLSLAPGGAVGVSFSVNNEQTSGTKQVTLRVEAFVGERGGRALPPGCLAVIPPATSIAPMDFEKFVLTGSLPADLPPDVYRGAVAVVSDTVIHIPVWLTVEPAPA